MADEGWAYLAGIVDGEGHLSIAAHISPGKTYVLRPTLEIGNTDKQLIDFCYKLLGCRGKIGVYTKNRQTLYYNCRLYSRDLEKPLQKLLPYLICKKSVANLALRFINLHQRYKGYSTEEIQIANQVRDMSRKNGHRARQIPLDKVVITHSDIEK